MLIGFLANPFYLINALALTNITLNDAKIISFNSSAFLKCGDNLATIDLNYLLTTPVINSANMAHLKLSSTLWLRFTQSGNYTINSDHFKSYTLSTTLYLLFLSSGTYTIKGNSPCVNGGNVTIPFDVRGFQRKI